MIVVYTAIFAGSDSLKSAPAADRCVCYTDGDCAGGGWEIVRVPRPVKPRAAARTIKMTPHELFPEASAWLWIDGSIAIRDYRALLAAIGDADIACMPHPDRKTCYDEGETVIRLKIAADKGKAQVRAALAKYRSDGFSPTALSTTGLFWRRNTPQVVAFNRLWHAELNAYGTNDQVHVDYCAWKAGIVIMHLPGQYRQNAFATYDKADHHRRRQPQFLLEAECEAYLE